MNTTQNSDMALPLSHDLLNQQGFWQAIENALLIGVQVYDQTGRLIYVNQAFLDMVQFDKSELLNRKIEDCPYIPTNEHENALTFKRHMLAHPKEMSSRENTQKLVFEGKFVRKDGTEFDGKMLANSVFNTEGHYVGWVKTIEDVTQINQLTQFRQQEEKRISAIHRLLSLGEITSSISHELNQPLAAIRSYAAALANMVTANRQDLTPDTLVNIVQKINAQAERASNVTRRVRQFAQKSEHNRVQLTVRELITQALILVETDLIAQQCSVDLIEAQPLDTKIRVERMMMEQTIINVIRNALDAMNEAGIKHKKIQIHTDKDAMDNVLIRISDNGKGIPEHLTETIFSLFYSSKPHGAGIGLNICRTVLEANGGRMWAETSPHGGVFYLSLPRATGR